MKEKMKNKPWVSTMLVAVNVVIFLICTFTGNMLYNMGEMGVLFLMEEKAYYRIITSMFLHADIHHLVNNMILLIGIGMMIEAEVGHIRYGIVYFLAGIGGNLASAAWELMSCDFYTSIGASGAVFGLDGMLAAMVLFGIGQKAESMEQVTPFRLFLMIGYSVYSGFTEANINNAAHIGGLLTGFLAMLPFCITRRIQWKKTGLEEQYED